MSEELDSQEQRFSDLFRQVEAPASVRRWDAAELGGGAVRRGPRWWARPFLALVTAGGERRLRPLAAALVLPVLVLAIGGGLQLRAHFTGSAGPAANPPARSDATMAFDAAHGQVVMFGGRGEGGVLLGDTWTWDGSSWTQQHPALSPSPRARAAMAFDAAHGLLVLYGGTALADHGSSSTSQETWTWDGSNWHQVTTGHRPAGIVAGMAYDDSRHQVVMVTEAMLEGKAFLQGGMQTHVFQTVPAPAQAVPPVTPGAPPVMHPVPAPVMVPVQGGAVGMPSSAVQSQLQTWTWSGFDWIQQHPHTDVIGWPSSSSLAWDAAAHRVVTVTSDPVTVRPLCGSVSESFGSVQAIPAPRGAVPPPPPMPTHIPTPLSAPTPVPAMGHAVAGTPPLPPPQIVNPPTRVDPCIVMEQRTVGSPSSGLHCNGCPVATQWSWDGSTWHKVSLGSGVSFSGELLLTDPTGGRPVAVDASHTWTWSGSKWVPHQNPAGLQLRFQPGVASDTAHHQLVLFGGLHNGQSNADTWTWDGSTWTHRAGPLSALPTPLSIGFSQGGGVAPAVQCGQSVSIDTAPAAAGAVTITVHRPGGICQSTANATLTLSDTQGKQLHVQGNGMSVNGLTVALLWTNWCGRVHSGSIEVQSSNASFGQSIDSFPSCVDGSKPSVLMLQTVTTTIP